ETTKTPCSSSFFAFSATGSGLVAAMAPLPSFGLGSYWPFWRTVKAWIGIVRTFFRVAVVIFAVEESPGRASSGGLSRATTTLKSFASWLETALWLAATPVERRIAVLPISMTWPLKVLFGMASMVTSATWPIFTLTISVSSTLTSEVMRDMSAIVMMVLAAEFWIPGT